MTTFRHETRFRRGDRPRSRVASLERRRRFCPLFWQFAGQLHVVTAFDAQFFEFGVERRALEAEALCGTVSAADLAPGLAENAQDVFPLRGMKSRTGLLQLLLFFGDLDVEDGAARKDDGALEEVFQLADVAGPWPSAESLHGFVADGSDVFAHAAAVGSNEVAHKDSDVSETVAKGRGKDRKDFQAVEKITSELLLG